MRATLAIVRLTLLAAVRSRLLQLLTGLLVLCVVGMPFLLKGDGTLAGRLRVLLTYAIGSAWLLLAIATLWAACGLVAREIEDRSLRLVVVKPVRTVQIWFGKWLGIAVLDLVLIGLVTVLVGLMLALTVAPHRTAATPADAADVAAILGSRHPIDPAQSSLAPLIEQQVADWLKRGLMPDTPEARRAAAQSARSDLMARRATVAPEQPIRWIFPPNRRLTQAAHKTGGDLRLYFRYTSSPLERRDVHGAWTFQCGDTVVGPRATGELFDGRHTKPLPEAIIAALRTAPTELAVTFTNGTRDESIAVMFDAQRPVAILVRDGTFGINLVRAQAIAFGFMCALGALGLAAGTLFSHPVALFAGISFLLAIAVANSHLVQDAEMLSVTAAGFAGWLNHVGEHLLTVTRAISAPAFNAEPLARLAEGAALPWALTGRTCAMLIIFYPILFGLAASVILARRQLAR